MLDTVCVGSVTIDIKLIDMSSENCEDSDKDFEMVRTDQDLLMDVQEPVFEEVDDSVPGFKVVMIKKQM